MSRLIPLSFALVALNACIFYENNGDADFGDDDGFPWDNDNDNDDDDDNDDNDSDDDDDTAPPQDPSGGFVISPNHAAAGDHLILDITATGDAALSDISTVTFDGAVDVVDVIPGGGSLWVIVDVDVAATPGAVDVVIGGNNGQAWVIDLGFTVDPAGSTPAVCE